MISLHSFGIYCALCGISSARYCQVTEPADVRTGHLPGFLALILRDGTESPGSRVLFRNVLHEIYRLAPIKARVAVVMKTENSFVTFPGTCIRLGECHGKWHHARPGVVRSALLPVAEQLLHVGREGVERRNEGTELISLITVI